MQGRPIVHALALALALHPLASRARTAPATASSPNAAQAASGADSVIGFRLSDQFGRVHDAAEYRGRALLLVGAGRGGRASGTAWVETLRRLQEDSGGAVALPVVAVADLRGVPRLLRRMVRGRFPDDRRQAVLLDWDGSLARRFGFDAERCTIVLIGPTGRTHAQTSPEAVVDTTLARAMLRDAAGLTSTALSGPPR